MQSVRTAVVPVQWARRLDNVYWPMVIWSAAAGGAGGLAGWALAEPLVTPHSLEPTYAVYLGVAGGFVGGLLFDLIGAVVITGATNTGTLNRFVADLVVGLSIGIMVALVEVAAKTAWLVAVSGKRAGTQFILSKDTTSIGRDDRDDVLLWGDPHMATRHARV